MKLISLNTWGGKVYQPLMDFIRQHSKDTDIFCFQEVFSTTSTIKESSGFRTNLLQEMAKLLKNFQYYFAPALDNYLTGSFQTHFTNFDLSSGQAIFIKKQLTVKTHGDFFIFGHKNSYVLRDFNTMSRNVQYITFTAQDKKFIVCNLHGIWRKGEKIDHPSRTIQSEKIKKFLEQYTEPKILCGDFNLNIDTKSLKILEENMINLIKDCKIPTTRSKLYNWGDKFADYTLVSPDVKVIDFQVPNINISDHLPMILEFS